MSKGRKGRKNALEEIAANSFAVLVERPNSLLKAGREMEVPMKAESYLSRVGKISSAVGQKKKKERGTHPIMMAAEAATMAQE